MNEKFSEVPRYIVNGQAKGLSYTYADNSQLENTVENKITYNGKKIKNYLYLRDTRFT